MSLIKKIKIYLIIILTTISVVHKVYSQAWGYPYVINFFNPDKLYLSSEVKDITFFPNGELVAATDRGVVLFDGIHWFKILDGNYLSIAYDSVSNTIYLGSTTSFGYLRFNSSYNYFEYVRLSLLVPDRITNTWYIIPSKYGIYFFVGGKYLYLYDYKNVEKIKLPKNFEVKRGFGLNDNLYVIDDNYGIAKIIKDKIVKLSITHKDIYSHSIRIFLPSQNSNEFLLVTKDGLVYNYNELTDEFIEVADIRKKISDIEVYNGLYINDSVIAISTLNRGLLLLNKQGEIIEHITRENGLSSDKVSSVKINPYNKILFLATGRFVNALFYFYPFRVYNEKNEGYLGDIGDYKIWNNKLFIGTDNGLFVSDKSERKFSILNGRLLFYRSTMDVFKMPDGKEFLLGGSLRYLFLVDKNLNTSLLGEYYNLYSIRQSKLDPYRFYALSFDSLFIFRFFPDQMRVKKEMSFYLPAVYSQMEINNKDEILLLSSDNKLVNKVKIDFKKKSLNLSTINTFYLVNKIKVIDDSIFVILSNKGLFKFSFKENQALPYDLELNKKLSNIMESYPCLDFYIHDNQIFLINKKFLYVYNIENSKLDQFFLLDKYWTSPKELTLYDNNLVFNRIYELVFVDINKLRGEKLYLQEKPILSVIQIGDYSFYNFFSDDYVLNQDSIYQINIPIPYNTPISFKFNIINTLVTGNIKYSYYLKGYSKKWSPWQTKDLTFNGLMPGRYDLMIKLLSPITDKVYNITVRFRVKPPFYLSNLALFLYVLVLAVFIYIVVRLRLRREEILRSKLEKLVRKRTKELEYKNKILEDNNKMLNLLTEELEANKEELLAQNERLRLINLELKQLSLVAQYTNNSVLILDEKGRIEWWNKEFAHLFKYKFKKEKGIYIPKSIKNLRPDIFERILNFDPNFKSVTYTTHEIIPETGEDIWYQTTITAVREEDGKIYRFVILDIDITESKLAEREIKNQRDKLQKQTEVLKKINQELLENRRNLERQHQEMLSSLEYAKRLQKALLPDELLRKLFPQSFIFYLPKEIVSGDFYYLDKRGDKIVFALGDATGHGVPGAFMSVLGITLLKDAIEKNAQELLPNKILETLRESVIKALHQNVIFSDIKDGLDIGVGIIEISTKKLYFSGANISINIIRDKDTLIEIRADRMAIGIKELADLPFNLEITDLLDKDRLYLYSDGFIDQFGGKKNKRYKRTRFKDFILTIQDVPMEKQTEVFMRELELWMNDNEQIDDILIIGVEIDFEHLQNINS